MKRKQCKRSGGFLDTAKMTTRDTKCWPRSPVSISLFLIVFAFHSLPLLFPLFLTLFASFENFLRHFAFIFHLQTLFNDLFVCQMVKTFQLFFSFSKLSSRFVRRPRKINNRRIIAMGYRKGE